MRNRIELILKLVCALLAAALLFHLFLAIIHANPLAKVSIPQIPTLAANTNTVLGTQAANSPTARIVTSSATNAGTTNSAKGTLTNAPAREGNTNAPAVPAVITAGVTQTNSSTAEIERPATNGALSLVKGNTHTITNASATMTRNDTNSIAATNTETVGLLTNSNVAARGQAIQSGTNTNPKPEGGNSGTNNMARTIAKSSSAGSRPDMAMMGMPGMPGTSGGGKASPELPPETKARIDRIYESELLGQIMRPMPAGLMGIAGNMAFLRSSSGQTGLVKEGDSLGDMKLVKIGTNRVLVEEGGQKKELMIFNGYGGDSLLSKKETPDESHPK